MNSALSLPHLLESVKETEDSNNNNNKSQLFYQLIRESIDDEQVIAQIEVATRKQASEPLWHECRKLRITASNAHAFLNCKGKINDSLLSCLQSGRTPEVPPIMYGRTNEPIAKRKFQNWLNEMGHNNVNIIDVGFKVCRELPFIGASPDGLVFCSCHPPTLLEVKCPYRLRHDTFENAKLEYLDSNNRLKQNHTYYTQIMTAMAAYSIPRCFFVVYSPCELNLIVDEVQFDVNRWDEMANYLANLYKTEVIPMLINE